MGYRHWHGEDSDCQFGCSGGGTGGPGKINTVYDYERRVRQARALIIMSLEDNQLIFARTSSSAKDIWERLVAHYETKSTGNKLFLKLKYANAKMEDGETMLEYITKMESIALDLDAIDASVSEEDQVANLLKGLPESYQNLVISFESRAESDLNLTFVTSRLLREEQRRNEDKSSKEESAFVSKSTNTAKGGSKKEERKVKNGKCHYCGKEGHWKNECWKRIAKQGTTSRANTARSHPNDEAAAFISANAAHIEGVGDWYLDSGATQHMTNRRDIFTSWEPIDKKYI